MASAMSCLLPSTASVMGYLKTGEWGGVGLEQTPSGSATDCLLDLLVTIATLENLCTRKAQSSRGGHSRRVEKIAC